MTQHSFRLNPKPFHDVQNGTKIIESRLYDEKRQSIKLGDEITVINRKNPTETLQIEVIGLLRYTSFEDLFEYNEPAKFGNNSRQSLMDQIREFYTPDDEERYGVIGIQFVVL